MASYQSQPPPVPCTSCGCSRGDALPLLLDRRSCGWCVRRSTFFTHLSLIWSSRAFSDLKAGQQSVAAKTRDMKPMLRESIAAVEFSLLYPGPSISWTLRVYALQSRTADGGSKWSLPNSTSNPRLDQPRLGGRDRTFCPDDVRRSHH